MRVEYRTNGHRSSLVLPAVLVELGIVRYGGVEEFKTHARQLAMQSPAGVNTTAWVRDTLILEFSDPELARQIGDHFRQQVLF